MIYLTLYFLTRKTVLLIIVLAASIPHYFRSNCLLVNKLTGAFKCFRIGFFEDSGFVSKSITITLRRTRRAFISTA